MADPYENGPQLQDKDGLPIRAEAINPQDFGGMDPTASKLNFGPTTGFVTGHLSAGFDRGHDDLNRRAWRSQESVQGNSANRMVGRYDGGYGSGR
jgi:hypothetical protein